MNAVFKRHYVASRHVSIDESMIGMKNRCIYIQYLPKRHCRFGIKKSEYVRWIQDVFYIELCILAGILPSVLGMARVRKW